MNSPGLRMLSRLAAVLLAATAAAPGVAADRDVNLAGLTTSVVKLYVTHQPWSARQPWSKEPTDRRTCSGFLVEQGILTNAHCVMDATFIQMEVPGLADRIRVERVAVNHQVDLALVRPADEDALPPGMHPIAFGSLPEQRETVVTIGYSVGGRQVSFTEGVVSRIDVMPYAHSRQYNLLVQTDAAINPGNSGGPVFSDRTGECLGMATQRFSGSIGYFIPVPVIRQFLTDIEDGAVDGIPYLGIQIQTLENPTLREYLGMTPGQSGVRVAKIATDSAAGNLLPNDVLMTIEGRQIFNDGRIPFRDSSRIGLAYEISTRQIGDSVRFSVLRNGAPMEISARLTERDYHVIPMQPQYDDPPPWFTLGGLLFRVVDPGYLEKDVPFNIRRYIGLMRGEERDIPHELVIVSTIFEADLNKGYDNTQENTRVLRVNERVIERLGDVPAALAAVTGRFHVIELDNGHVIVLDRDRVAAEEQAIRERYKIR
ncbi:MAG: trypsin-like peptidase domain-containing protein [Gammaproteobacteria bacterium]|jgi:S1-C subfamily serine protease|nr:trypsin-like peptidase domain-containing protein [Gammaproteobacteria bacterium]